jgi:hypothetical protein
MACISAAEAGAAVISLVAAETLANVCDRVMRYDAEDMCVLAHGRLQQ